MMDELAEEWSQLYYCCVEELKTTNNITLQTSNIMPLLRRMELIFNEMQALIPESHFDHINLMVYGIHRKF